MSNNEDKPKDEALELPKWLDATLLETAFKKNFSVKSLQLVNAIAPGENYACVVYRAVAETTLGPIPLIVKAMPESEFRSKFLREAGLTVKEIRMYEHTIPMLRGKLDTFRTALCYHTVQDDVHDTLILQDLGPLGFRTRKRHLGLDVAHCRLALTQLAHLHGFSVALRVQEPLKFKEEMKHYKDLMYTDDKKEINVPMLKNMMKSLAESLRAVLPLRFHKITHLMEHMGGEHAFDKLASDFNPDLNEPVLVLNHGDFWSNNMLFQYKDGSEEPLACVPIDFQICRCASPTLDLQYFLYTSTTQATRRAHLDELLKLYLDETRWAMKQKGVEDPGKAFYSSLDELKQDMKRYAFFGFIFPCFVLPIVVANPEDAISMDDMTEESIKEGTTPFNQMYRGDLFRERMQEFLEDFDDSGFFQDYLQQYPNAINKN